MSTANTAKSMELEPPARNWPPMTTMSAESPAISAQVRTWVVMRVAVMFTISSHTGLENGGVRSRCDLHEQEQGLRERDRAPCGVRRPVARLGRERRALRAHAGDLGRQPRQLV